MKSSRAKITALKRVGSQGSETLVELRLPPDEAAAARQNVHELRSALKRLQVLVAMLEKTGELPVEGREKFTTQAREAVESLRQAFGVLEGIYDEVGRAEGE